MLSLCFLYAMHMVSFVFALCLNVYIECSCILLPCDAIVEHAHLFGKCRRCIGTREASADVEPKLVVYPLLSINYTLDKFCGGKNLIFKKTKKNNM